MLSRVVAFLGLAAVVLLVACGSGDSEGESTLSESSEDAPVAGPVPGITVENYPRVDGSTSAYPLGQLLAARAVGLPGELRRTSGPSWGGPDRSLTVVFPIESNMGVVAQFRLLLGKTYHHGTHESYMNLVEDKADVILVARAPSDDELKAAKEQGVTFDVRPIALDAFVFLVNVENPVTSLNMAQIIEIYTGKATNWKDVGGTDEEITAFTRNPNSGSQELMLKLVMKDRTIIESNDRMLMGMAGPIDRVSSEPKAIAYSVYYYERFINPHPNNKLIGVDGVTPSRETIAARSYPLTTDVYVVTRDGLDANSPAAKLRDWILSDDGQRLVAESGYVPIGED